MSVLIVVVGSANADVVVAAPRRPCAGETVLCGDTVIDSGGKGANAAVAAARLGATVAIVGAVGRDPYGDLMAAAMADAGIDITHLRRTGRPSGAAYITITPDGENSILVSPGANADVSAADVDAAAEVIAGARVLVCSLEVPVPTVCHAVAVAERAGTRCVLNASPVAILPAETLAVLDPLVVNEHEAAWLPDANGTGDPDELAARLLELGPRSLVVTLGARGALVADHTGVTTVNTPTVAAVDTTGAGDAFAGALAARLAGGDPLVVAAEYAAAVAAISVTRQGAQSSYPTAAELPES
ncbi:MAG: PfkB family carbohydrate kinase [Sciscionella sp.]